MLSWDKRVVEKTEVAKGRFSIKCKFSCVVGNFDWVFSWGMYGSNSDHDKGLLYEELIGI